MRVEQGKATLFFGDSRDVLRELPDASIDACVTDPPYALVSIVKRFGKEGAAPAKGNDAYERASRGFMGKTWDTGETAFAVEFWAEVMRVLKPGGYVIAASGTRTYHRLAVAIEDAGFEIRDMISWLYGSGFPKSLDVSKAIDKAAGASRQVIGDKRDLGIWNTQNCSNDSQGIYSDKGGHLLTAPATPDAIKWSGWGTALKPACEPWVLARKPLIGTVANNVLTHGTGAINVDGCRVGVEGGTRGCDSGPSNGVYGEGLNGAFGKPVEGLGRFPANVIHDGSDEVVEAFGEPHRFFYSAKASKADRNEGCDDLAEKMPTHGKGHEAGGLSVSNSVNPNRNNHPTVKPVDLMRYLCRLVTQPGGVVLDPFMGSGSTGKAALAEGFSFIGIEREREYFDIAQKRVAEPVELAIRKMKRIAEETGQPSLFV